VEVFETAEIEHPPDLLISSREVIVKKRKTPGALSRIAQGQQRIQVSTPDAISDAHVVAFLQ
jgi:hypothetical protein